MGHPQLWVGQDFKNLGCATHQRMTASDKFKIVRRRYLIARICSCVFLVAPCQAYLTSTWQLERLAQAPVLATCVVQETSRDSSAVMPGHWVVSAHATLRVLRSFPQLALREGEQIRLDFDALPEGDSGMNGPSVPNITPGAVLVLPLKLNPSTTTESWRLIGDEGVGLVIPAALRRPPFAGQVTSRLDYVLREIASPLSGGTRTEVFAEAWYLRRQDAAGYAAELMRLLESEVGADQNRWALIAASLVGSLGVPRPTIADFYSGKHPAGMGSFSGPLLTLVLQRLGGSAEAKGRLIHQLLAASDIASWGVGVTLREFAQDPRLTRELLAMLKARRPGSLEIAREILSAGQKGILKDATALAFRYIESPSEDHAELQPACWIVRDFGSDRQFSRLVGAIRRYQYQNTQHYDELWRDTIWPDNNRESAVLEILLADQRTYESGQRYSDIARGELARLQAPQSEAR